MSEKYGIKVEEIFNTMEERFRPEGAEGINESFGYDIKDRGKWKLTVKDGNMKIEQSDDLSDCIVTLKADADSYVGAQIGKVDWGEAFSAGKISVDGDMGALAMTGKLFKKFVAPKKGLTNKEYVLDMIGTLSKRFIPKAAQDVTMEIAYNITGPDGGEWTAKIENGTITVKEGFGLMPTLKINVEDQSYIEWQLGKTDAMTLMAMGKAGLEGNAVLAQKIPELFEKYSPPGEAEDEQELLALKKVISVDQRFSTGPVMGKFLNGLKEKKIFANKCPECGRMQIPPREICAECRVRVDEFVEVGPKGNVRYMDTAYFASPDPLTGETRETPYGTAHILLDGCKGHETLAFFIRQDQLDRIEMGWNDKKGTIVRPVWNEERTGHVKDIKYFEIDE